MGDDVRVTQAWKSSEPTDDEQGLFRGRYAVLRTLGFGGMGKVFEAYDTRLGRTVALKLMRSRVCERPSFVQRFRREYRAMTRIEHAGVPRVFDAGIDEIGRAYFTMEVVQGRALTAIFTRPLEPVDALRLIEQVASILVAVHAAGIIHRDIKPSNIVLDREWRPHLIDFGACYLVKPELAPIPGFMPELLHTARGTWLGTLGYVDPAVLDGAPCSVRSDVYSLVATLAWLLSGQHPSDEAPVPTTGNAVVDRLLERGMAKRPGDRPATVDELLVDIAEVREVLRPTPAESRAERSVVRPVPGRWFSPARVLAIGALGGVLGGPVTGGCFRGPDPPVVARTTNDAVRAEVHESGEGARRMLAPRPVVTSVAPEPAQVAADAKDRGAQPPRKRSSQAGRSGSSQKPPRSSSRAAREER